MFWQLPQSNFFLFLLDVTEAIMSEELDMNSIRKNALLHVAHLIIKIGNIVNCQLQQIAFQVACNKLKLFNFS